MIYLHNNTEEQRIYVPKVLANDGEVFFHIRLHSTMHGQGAEVYAADLSSSVNYYVFDISLPAGLSDGEYEYEIEGNTIKSRGLAMLTADKRDVIEYNKTIQYEQYQRAE